MNKSKRPHSVLILFSNDFEPTIENWCSGSVVFEIETRMKLDSFPEVAQLKEMLSRFGEIYTKVTVVTNPKIASVTMCRLSGRFTVSVYIVGSNGYKSFDSYIRCVENFFRVKVLLDASKTYSAAMKRKPNFRVHPSYFDYSPSKELKAILNTHVHYESILRRVLDSPFQ